MQVIHQPIHPSLHSSSYAVDPPVEQAHDLDSPPSVGVESSESSARVHQVTTVQKPVSTTFSVERY